jgi:hypothetical protein
MNDVIKRGRISVSFLKMKAIGHDNRGTKLVPMLKAPGEGEIDKINEKRRCE